MFNMWLGGYARQLKPDIVGVPAPLLPTERNIMDIKAIADQVMGALGNSPEAIRDFIADPAAAIEGITGNKLEGADLAGVVDQIKETVMGGDFQLPEGLDLGNLDLSGIAGNLGGMLENSPLSGIAEGLGSLFGKK